MLKAYEVMTHAVATCAPDASVADVATMMRDRNIGAVLVLDDGELRGIVTDRDLTIQALTGNDGALQQPIERFMSAPVITGEPTWNLEKVADLMAKHQVRRLPILQDGQLAGIVSLGDVALHVDKKQVVAKSLQAISEPDSASFLDQMGRGRLATSVMLAAILTMVFAVIAMNRSGRSLPKQFTSKKLYNSARQAVNTARDKVDEVAPRETVLELRDQLLSKLSDLSEQVQSLQPQPKHKRRWSF